jgi:hypothetical protein
MDHAGAWRCGAHDCHHVDEKYPQVFKVQTGFGLTFLKIKKKLKFRHAKPI